MQLGSLDLKSFFFLGLLIILGMLMFQLFVPFLAIIVISLVLVELFYPVYTHIYKLLGHKVTASIISTLATLLLVIIPLIIIFLLAFSEITTLLSSLPAMEQDGAVLGETTTTTNNLVIIEDLLAPHIESINRTLADLNILDASGNLVQIHIGDVFSFAVSYIKDAFFPFAQSVISTGVNALFYLFLIIISLVYLFIEYDRIPEYFSKISPLDNRFDKLLVTKFKDTTRAVIKGNFIVAIAQASAVSLVLGLMGVGAPVLLWLIMVILSLVPIGSGLVWFPIGLFMIANGQSLEGIGLIVYSGIIINVIDALLRPVLMRDGTNLHPLIILFSVLGGIAVFGPIGVLYGPIISVFFTSLMGVYFEYFSGDGNIKKA